MNIMDEDDIENEYRPLFENKNIMEEDRKTFNKDKEKQGLSLLFATLCIIDLFGVFPVVTMPRSIIDCGWLGIPLVFSVFFLQVYTAILLGRCWIMAENIDPSIKRKSRQPYSALAEMIYGRIPGHLVTLLLDLTVFAGGVPNLLVASQNMQLLGEKAALLKWDISYCYWMPLIGLALCPFMWLGSPKDMKWLVVSSSCVVLMVSILTWISIISANVPLEKSPVNTENNWEAIAIAYGILAFQFDIHPMILTVQVDMANKEKLGQAVVAGFSVTGSLFIITTILATLKFGSDLEYNLLRSLQSSQLLDINVLLVTLQVFLSTVVGCTALFQDLEDKLGVKKEFNWSRCLIRTSLVLLSVMLSEIVPRFDLIMGLVGGSMMGPIMFILPPLFYSKLRAMELQPELESIVPLSKDDLISISLNEHSYLTTPVTKKKYFFPLSRQKHKRNKNRMYKNSYKILSNDNHENIGFKSLLSSCIKCSFITNICKKTKNNISNIISLDNEIKYNQMIIWERLKLIIIVCCGLIATFLSTYYSLSEAIHYARFTPPCLINVTAATLAVH